MPLEHHSLVNDLPDFKDQIHALKQKDAHFSKLLDTYTNLTNEIEELEKAGSPTSDDQGQLLKSRRVHLKDNLAAMLAQDKLDHDDGCGCGAKH